MTPAESRKAWARHYIAQAPVGVTYGSPEWLALPEGPEKWGVAIVAAEARLSEAEADLERLRVEHLGAALEQKQAEDAEYVEQVAKWRRNWDGRRGGFRRPDPAIAADVEREWAEWVRGEAS